MRAIREQAPDVIGFQEVRARKVAVHNESRSQVADLAALLGPGYQYVPLTASRSTVTVSHSTFISSHRYTYVPAMGFAESEHEYVHEGLAIFSRFPIVASDHLRLSRDPNDGSDFHQRICMRARIATPLGFVNMMTTHLSLSKRARRRTLKEIGKWAAESKEPSVLVGDFNAEFGARDSNPLVSKHGWHDAWADMHAAGAKQKGWTFNTWEPKSRIDYVLLQGLTALGISVEGSKGEAWSTHLWPIAGVKDMKRTMFPSDHMFLKARLTLTLEPKPEKLSSAAVRTEL